MLPVTYKCNHGKPLSGDVTSREWVFLRRSVPSCVVKHSTHSSAARQQGANIYVSQQERQSDEMIREPTLNDPVRPLLKGCAFRPHPVWTTFQACYSSHCRVSVKHRVFDNNTFFFYNSFMEIQELHVIASSLFKSIVVSLKVPVEVFFSFKVD